MAKFFEGRWKQLLIPSKVLHENHRQGLSNSQKISKTATWTFNSYQREDSTAFEIQDEKNPTNTRTVNRNHLVEETLPPIVEEYVPTVKHHDDFCREIYATMDSKVTHAGVI